MLTVNNVTKKYGDFTALSNVSLSFDHGVYALLAPNGAGKTTLIKMLTTLMLPTEGAILYNGVDIIKMGSAYRDRLGFLPQQFGYYKSYSPRQYLSYIAALKGIEKQAAKQRIEELLDAVSLSDSADKKMRKFSGGMIQRVGIAQALLNDPEILILDEPTAGLDPKERVRFRNIISGFSKDRTVILSTHIVSDIETVAGQVIILKEHQVFCVDSVAGICKQLDGRVFELPADEPLPDNSFFVSDRQYTDGLRKRFVADKQPAGAVAMSPNLEDVFLYVFKDEGGSK